MLGLLLGIQYKEYIQEITDLKENDEIKTLFGKIKKHLRPLYI